MGGFRCKGDDDSGKEAREIACCRREIVRDRRPMIGATCLGVRFRPTFSDPRRQPPAANDAETRISARRGIQHGGAQLLVSTDRVRYGDGQTRLFRFFLRAGARSRLRRCTLTPKRSSIASRHSGVVSSGLAALRSTTKAIISAEILWPPLGPRRLGSRPGSPAISRAP